MGIKVFLSVVFVNAYFLAAKISLPWASLHGSVSPVWVPTGIAIATVFLLGFEFSWSILVGAFLANYFLTPVGFGVSFGIAAGNALEAYVAAKLLHRFAPDISRFNQVSSVFRFLLIACAIAPAVSASIGVLSLSLGDSNTTDPAKLWFTWWVGDGVGALLIAPFIFILSEFDRRCLSFRNILEAGFLISATVLTAHALYSVPMAGIPTLSYGSFRYLAMPISILAAVRFREFLSPTLLLVFAAFAVWGTSRGLGPFAGSNANDSLLSLQLSLFVRATTFYIFSALFSERARTLSALQKASFKLESANRELNNFATTASHDLRSPLKTITSFLVLIDEKVEKQNDSEMREFIQHALKASKRLQAVIEDLLRMARLGTEPEKDSNVDLNEVLRDVTSNLYSQLEKTGGEIKVAPLPVVYANRSRLLLLFQNLIDNSIKFKRESNPVIQIGAEKKPGGWLVKVTDNGIGIPDKAKDRIFQAFVRLNSREKFEGSGLGLATCKKIIDIIGGRMWFESKEGTGTTFFILFPDPSHP